MTTPRPTAKQAKLLGFVHAYHAEHGHAPTIRELQQAMGASSPSTVHHALHRLKQQGWLRPAKRGSPRTLALARPWPPGGDE